MKFVVLLLVPALSVGCYTYSPIEVAAVTPGMEVRARVSAATAAQLAPSLSMSDARLLTGAVVDTQGGLTLKVPSTRMGVVGGEQDELFQQILIARSDLLELESKQLDNGRTRLAVIAGVAGAVALTAGILHGRSSGAPAVTEPPGNFNIRVGGVRIGLAYRHPFRSSSPHR